MRRVAGGRHAAGVVAGDDLVGHLVVEHRARAAVAEPDHVRVPRQRGNRRGVGGHLDGMEGAVGGGLRDAHGLRRRSPPASRRRPRGRRPRRRRRPGWRSSRNGRRGCCRACRPDGRLPTQRTKAEAADALRRRGVGPDEIGVVRVVLQHASARVLERGVPVALRRAEELHQTAASCRSRQPWPARRGSSSRLAVAQRIEGVAGNTHLAGVGDEEIGATGGEPVAPLRRRRRRPSGRRRSRSPGSDAPRGRELGEVGLRRQAQERLGSRGPGGEKKKSSSKEDWQPVRHRVSRASVQAGESSPDAPRSPGR